MSLEIFNNDVIGVEQFGQPEMLDFWEVVKESMGGHDFFPHDSALGDDLDALISDKNRIWKQANKLVEIMPNRKHQTLLGYRRAMDEIEKKCAKILGRQCVYKCTIVEAQIAAQK